MYRVIVRFSLNADIGSAHRNAVVNELKALGLRRSGTSTWHHPNLGLGDIPPLADSIRKVIIGNMTGTTLDHLWIYIDIPDEAEEGYETLT